MRHALFAASLFAFTSIALAHSGGTDSNGCHTNHKTGDYHCHNPKRSVPTVAGATDYKPVLMRTVSGPTCHTGPRGGTYTITASGRKNYGGC